MGNLILRLMGAPTTPAAHTTTTPVHRDTLIHLEDLLAATREDAPPQTPINKPSHIIDSIWIGGAHEINESEFFVAHDITHVVSLGPQVPGFPGFESMCDSISKGGITDDTEGASVLFRDRELYTILNWMRHARSRRGTVVLVHCDTGVSRSATVVVAYLMVFMGASLDEALDLVKHRRPWAFPSTPFMAGLATL